MFVQIIEGRTTDPEGIRRQGERWQAELRPGAAGFLGVTAGATADGRAITFARFRSEAEAQANSDRPEQGDWWAEMAKYFEGEVTFTDSTEVQEFLGGGSEKARFVQVLKMSHVDRARLERLDQSMPEVANVRPDLLGVFRIWTGPTSCFDVNYFTTEAEARAGERKDIPTELEPLRSEFSEITRHTEFLDLSDPQIY